MVDFESFKSNIPKNLLPLLDRINSLGFKAYLIGGIPRDYLMKREIGTDFDFELRPYKEEGFEQRYQHLIESLRDDGLKLREMGLGIREILFEGFSVEFGLPRVEEFTDEVHHSNFKAIHIPDIDFSKGFKRRDFTINAVAFEYDQGWRLVDPLRGVDDIQKKLLRPCDPASFVKDPVRFLRAIRFSLKLDLVIAPVLRTLLENMVLKISSHYLKLEAGKSTMPLLFYLEALKLRRDVFDHEELIKEEESVREYSKKFPGERTKKHIEEAFFLGAKLRKALLEEMGMSSKGVLEFPLKEMNISSVKSRSPQELMRSSWVRGAMKFFASAEDIGEKKINWLMRESGSEYDFSFIQAYNELKIEPSKEISPELKSFALFKAKIEALLK